MNEYLELFTHYFHFKGRTSRKVYWVTMLGTFLISIIINNVLRSKALSSLWNIAIFIPSLAIRVRRLIINRKVNQLID